MPTLAVHSFGNERDEHFETFYRPDDSSAGWFRSYGTLDRVAFEISALLELWNAKIEEVGFENRYGISSDRKDYEEVLLRIRKNLPTNA